MESVLMKTNIEWKVAEAVVAGIGYSRTAATHDDRCVSESDFATDLIAAIMPIHKRYLAEKEQRIRLEEKLHRRRKTIANLEEVRAYERDTEDLLLEALVDIIEDGPDQPDSSIPYSRAMLAVALYFKRLDEPRE
jgi:hypothetical protein